MVTTKIQRKLSGIVKIAILRKKYIFHGGAEGFSQSLIEQLVKAGNEIHIYAIKWEGNVSKGVHFHRVQAIRFNSFLRDLTFAISSYFLLKKEDFDIIQSHDKTLYQDIYRAGDGCHIEWLRQRWKRTNLLGRLLMMFNPYHWLVLALERLIFKGHRFKKVIAISELVKKNITQHYSVKEEDIEVIYNGVDLERFHPRNKGLYSKEIRVLYNIPENEFVVLFVGSGFERKGVGFLITAIEKIQSPLTVLIVGKGSKKSFEKTIKTQRVIFCGPQKDIHKYYAASNVFVFPTIYEPFGNVHLEALASGLPVITTRLSGASEIIKNGIQGFIIDEPENVGQIAEKIMFLMNKDANQTMSIKARRLAERFSFEEHINKMSKFYSSVLNIQNTQ